MLIRLTTVIVIILLVVFAPYLIGKGIDKIFPVTIDIPSFIVWSMGLAVILITVIGFGILKFIYLYISEGDL